VKKILRDYGKIYGYVREGEVWRIEPVETSKRSRSQRKRYEHEQ
jgi:hypothetical protein